MTMFLEYFLYHIIGKSRMALIIRLLFIGFCGCFLLLLFFFLFLFESTIRLSCKGNYNIFVFTKFTKILSDYFQINI